MRIIGYYPWSEPLFFPCKDRAPDQLVYTPVLQAECGGNFVGRFREKFENTSEHFLYFVHAIGEVRGASCWNLRKSPPSLLQSCSSGHRNLSMPSWMCAIWMNTISAWVMPASTAPVHASICATPATFSFLPWRPISSMIRCAAAICWWALCPSPNGWTIFPTSTNFK